MSAESAAEAGRGTKRRRGLGRILRPLLALAILAFALSGVAWRDALVLAPADAAAPGALELAIPGTLVGDWRSGEVEFRPAEAPPADSTWPAPLAAAARAGRAFTAVRGQRLDGRIVDWRPSLPSVLRGLDPGWVLTALLLLVTGIAIVSARWWRLLLAVGVPATYGNTLRLSSLGLFFNLVMPGLTGGDIVKAVLVVRENPRQRADALVSVIVDRAIGLVVLLGIAAIAVVLGGERFSELVLPVTGGFAVLAAGLVLLVHPWPRRLLRLDRLFARLPFGDKLAALDAALQLYAARPYTLAVACLLTIVNHLVVAGAISCLGRAAGDGLRYVEHVALASIANTVSALPLSPAGWGVGEAAFRELYRLVGADPTLGVGVSVSFRLLMTGVGLAGGLALLLPGRRVHLDELEAVREGVEAEGSAG